MKQLAVRRRGYPGVSEGTPHKACSSAEDVTKTEEILDARYLSSSVWNAYICLLIFGGGLPLSPVIAAQTMKFPLPISVLASERSLARFCGLALSPDGKLAAVGVQEGRRQTDAIDTGEITFTSDGTYRYAWNCDIVVVDTQTGTSRNITRGKNSNWAPAWSPDGEQLAFYSDRDGAAQLWIWNRASDTVRRTAHVVVRSSTQSVQWTPDSGAVIARILTQGDTPQKALDSSLRVRRDGSNGEGVFVYQSKTQENLYGAAHSSYARTPAWNFDYAIGDLALINVRTGGVRRIARNLPIAAFKLSPDGRQAAYSIYKGFENENRQTMLYDFALCSVKDNVCKVLASDIHMLVFGRGFNWSPDGRLLAYMAGDKLNVVANDGAASGEYALPAGQHFSSEPYWDDSIRSVYLMLSHTLWKVDLQNNRTVAVVDLAAVLFRDTSDDQRLHAEQYEDLSLIAHPNGNMICCISESGKNILLRGENANTRRVGLFNLDLTSGKAKTLWEEEQGVLSEFVVSANLRQIVYEAEETNRPNDLWAASTGGSPPKRITDLNPEFQQYALGSGQIVKWTTPQGDEVRGALVLPGNYQPGQRYPLVICVYGGGDRSYDLNNFGGFLCGHGLPQLLASRGFGFLTTGAPLRIGTPMADLASAVLPAIDRLVDMGIVDPKRVGVLGHSDGGYDVLSLVVQTNRFKAAVMLSGYGDLFGQYGVLNLDGSSYGVARVETGESTPMGVTPWEDRLRYVENSPAYYLDRVQTPMLILHGRNDPFVPDYLSDQLFVGLRRLGKDVEYVKYDREGHFQEFWSFGHRVDYYTRVVEWFQRYLKAISSRIELPAQTDSH